ncbi:N-acetylmuramoyl-L-alanine amidase [Salipaludibacillus sp. CF4.18]|uniref:N-acetylmuramoyl-L-alanine amidase n=1 Tax=Salipaludibacillus sp. CF4.18 TaxID=3373081 RepID=UPI003EE7E1F4
MLKKFAKLFIISPIILLAFTLLTHTTYAEINFERISGDDRVNTAIEISKKGWPNGVSNQEKTVIIARADHPADALSSAGLAGYKNSPILLTFPNQLNSKLETELKRLKAEKVYLLGGEAAISDNVSNRLAAMGMEVERISGDTRYETALAINNKIGNAKDGHALLVNGVTIADALSASGVAATTGLPVYLTTEKSLSVNLPSEVNEVTIIGGTSVISDNILKDLNTQGIKTNRLSGSNRFETNLKVNNHFKFTGNDSILVRGLSSSTNKEDYPDAVAAAGLSSQLGAPVVLTHPTQGQEDIRNYLGARTGSTYVMGGEVAIASVVLNHLNNVFSDDSVTNATVNAKSGVNIRNAPNGTVQGNLSKGTLVEIHDFEGDWAKVRYNGNWGYVHSFYLSIKGDNHLLRGYTIVVDPGHGAHDSGAAANGIKEKDVVLDIGLRLEKKLKSSGANVVMTRRTDVFLTLSERVQVAEKANADTFISVHANANNSEKANGIDTFHYGKYSKTESEELAKSIQKRLIYDTEATDRGTPVGNFHVIRESRMPSVLVETGFITNKAEAEKFKTSAYKESVAEAVYQGIIDFHK